ncbi:MAG: adenosine kinase [Alphaproteobacteria bacterium]
MSAIQYDVVGIGNAIVDVVSHADDAFIAAQGLGKGLMTLIDADRAVSLYEAMGPGIEASGGSAGNTMAALARLGGRGCYIGKVRDDQLGQIFQHDIRAAGVAFDTAMATDGPPTARCLIVVTPDAERTMNTFLGACLNLTPDDIDPDTIAAAQVTYMEGYLWDPPEAKKAFLKAADIAHGADRQVSISLSDPFCVDRHRDELRDLVDGHIDILFANEAEICSLYQVEDFDAAVEEVRGRCKIAALTRSEKGSVVVTADETVAVAADKPKQLVDSTGAGDYYAAGFLHGLTSGRSLADCARIGGIAAAEVIAHLGARPDTDLAALVRERLN